MAKVEIHGCYPWMRLTQNKDGNTPIMLACRLKLRATIMALFNADPIIITTTFLDLLHWADVEFIHSIVEKAPFALTSRNEFTGSNVVHYVVRIHNYRIHNLISLPYFWQQCPHLFFELDHSGWTPFEVAVGLKSTAAVEMLKNYTTLEIALKMKQRCFEYCGIDLQPLIEQNLNTLATHLPRELCLIVTSYI